jgi:hypothetical protein
MVYDELMAVHYQLEDVGLLTADRWQAAAGRALDLLLECDADDPLRHALVSRVRLTTDPDVLFTLVQGAFEGALPATFWDDFETSRETSDDLSDTSGTPVNIGAEEVSGGVETPPAEPSEAAPDAS